MKQGHNHSLKDPEKSSLFKRATALILAALFMMPQPMAFAAATISGFDGTTVNYDEMAGQPVSVAPNLVISDSVGFDEDSYIKFSIDDAKASERLDLDPVASKADISTVSGAVSVYNDIVYMGDGNTYQAIGGIDSSNNGKNGSPLQINFSRELENASFLEGAVNTNFDNTTTVLPGWTVTQGLFDLTAAGLNSRSNGQPLSISGTGPYTMTRTDQTYSYTTDFGYNYGAWLYESFQRGTYLNTTIKIVSDVDKVGNQALELFSSGSVNYNNRVDANGSAINYDVYGSAFGPVVTSSPFKAVKGEKLSLDWKAKYSSDHYEVYGYLQNVTTKAYTLLFYGRGQSQAWTTSEGTIPADGEYQFVFINGTYDKTGGFAVGSYLYIDNIKVYGQTYADSVAAAIAVKVRYLSENKDPEATRTLNLEVANADSAISTSKATINITNQFSHAPELTATALNPYYNRGASSADLLFSGATSSTIEADEVFTALEMMVTGVRDVGDEKLVILNHSMTLADGTSGTITGVGDYSITAGKSDVYIQFENMGLTSSGMNSLINSIKYENSALVHTLGTRTVGLIKLTDSGLGTAPNVNETALTLSSDVSVTKVIEDLSYQSRTTTTALLTWTDPVDATQVLLQRSVNGTNWTTVATNPANPYTATGLSETTSTYFRLVVTGGENAGISNLLEVAAAFQTITFNAIEQKRYGDADFQLSAASSSRLPVSYSSSNTAVATVTSSGEVTLVGTGTTTITASQPGDGIYYPAIPVSRDLVVAKRPASVTPDPQSKVYGDSDPTLTGTLSGFIARDNVTAAYTRAAGESAGDYTVSAILSPTNILSNYIITYQISKLTIQQRPLTVTATAATKVYDGTTSSSEAPAITSGTLAVGDTGSWVQTYDTKEVGSSKTLTPKGSVLDSGTDKTANYNITFSKVTSGKVTAASPVITVSDKTASYSGSAIEIDPAVISGISEKPSGTVTYTYYTDRACSTLTTPASSGAETNGGAPVYAGVYYAKATIAAYGNYSAMTTAVPATLTIQGVDGSAFELGSDLTKTYGDASFQLSTSGGSGTGAVTYTSSNPNAAYITSGGYVTIQGVGSATITAIKVSDGNYKTQTDSMVLTVQPKSVSYTISNNSKSYTGDILYASVVPSVSGLRPGTDYTVVYTLDGKTVDEPRDNGTYAIVVSTLNSNYSGSANGTLTISSTGQFDLQISGLPQSTIEYGDTFKLSANGGSGTGAVSWKSSDVRVAAVSSKGEVVITGVGNVTLTVVKAADANYVEQEASVVFQAEKKTIAISAIADDRVYEAGNTEVEVTLNTGINGVGASYNSATILTDAAGKDKVVTITGIILEGEASAYYVPENTTVYTTVDIGIVGLPSLTTGLMTEEGVADLEEIEKTFGDSDFRLGYVSDSRGDVTWSSSDESVVRIKRSTGVVEIIGAGTAVITAEQDSDGNYEAASDRIEVTILKQPVTYTVVNNTKAYTGEAQYAAISPSVRGLIEGADYAITYSREGDKVEHPTDAGVYRIVVETENDNYTGTTTGAELTIAAVDQSYALEIGGLPRGYIEYEDQFALFANGGNGTGKVSWHSSNDAVVTVTSEGAVEITGVGTVTISATKDGDNNYNEQTSAVTFTVVRKEIQASISGTKKTYTGDQQTITVTGTLTSNHRLSDILNIAYHLKSSGEEAQFKHVDVYNVTVEVDPDYQDRYVLANALMAEAVIQKAELTVNATAADVIYGDETPEVKLEYAGLLGSDQPSDLDDLGFETGTNYKKGSVAGTYSTWITSGTAEDSNYKFTALNGSEFTVGKKNLTVTAKAQDIEFGDAAPAVTLTIEGFVMDEDAAVLDQTEFELGTNYSFGDAPGNYRTTISDLGSVDDNYQFVGVNTSEFDVNKRRVTIAAANMSKIAGRPDPELTYTITSGSLVNPEDLKLAVTRESGEDTGKYKIQISEADSNPNYQLTFVDGTLTIRNSSGTGGLAIPVLPEDNGGIRLVVDGSEEMMTGTPKTVDGKKVIELAVKDSAQEVKTVLNGDLIKSMEEEEATVAIQQGSVRYAIPAKQLTVLEIAQMLGKSADQLASVEFEITMKKTTRQETEAIQKKAAAAGYEMVSAPVRFEITAIATNKNGFSASTRISKFKSYVSREFAIPESLDPGKITTGIVYNDDGTFSHIPTVVYQKDGRWFAKLQSVTNSIYSIIFNPVQVTSVKGHWSETAVEDMASRLVIDHPEAFKPDDAITRGEFAEYITKALGLYRTGVAKNTRFKDVNSGHELADAITTAVEYGIIKGYPDGTFRPEEKITRQEAMVMYANAMALVELKGTDLSRIKQYSDQKQVSDWAYTAVQKTLAAGVFNGTSSSTIDPAGTFTYGEAAAAIRNLLIKAGLINA